MSEGWPTIGSCPTIVSRVSTVGGLRGACRTGSYTRADPSQAPLLRDRDPPVTVSRPRHALLPALLAASLVLAACGGDEAADPAPSLTPVEATPSPTPEPSPTPTSEPEPEGVRGPLNGVFHPEEELDQRVVAVKIDNHVQARPQSGLEEADAIYETLVEGGLTRFIALYHTASPDYVGPNRSGRPTDTTLVRPLNATFVISGAQDWVLGAMRRAGVDVVGDEGPPTSFRVRSRSAPHNLYVDVAAVREAADDRGYGDEPPAPMWTFEEWGEDVGESVSAVILDWSTSTDVRWEWDGSAWLRIHDGQQHATVTRDGDASQISADVLVILEAPPYTASSPSGGGSAVPALDTVGSGRAVVLGPGRVVEGEWRRDSIAEPFTLTDGDGDPLTVPPGRSWISVFPTGRTIELAP